MIRQHSLRTLQESWESSAYGTENSLHQLAPYIGKLKSTLARALIEQYSKVGDTVFDPFCGSGVIPLEAACSGRKIIANDVSPYAQVLTLGKLHPKLSLEQALEDVALYVTEAKERAAIKEQERIAPPWVSAFFHPKTLAEITELSALLRENDEWFLLANLLGILHHQRPGFLSYPASHLVPYLRTKKFPPLEYPQMYEYRDVGPRIESKLRRTYKRITLPVASLNQVSKGDALQCVTATPVEALITSPPYMNALAYGRDNRLRLWLVNEEDATKVDEQTPRRRESFSNLMSGFAVRCQSWIKPNGVAVLVVGEVKRGSNVYDTKSIVCTKFQESGFWRLEESVEDVVPDIRRSRRDCSATKTEHILVFSRV